ncbi:MAG: hypothetical protein AB9836_04870 [Aminipila sp.]
MNTFFINLKNASVGFHNKTEEVNADNRFDGSLKHYKIFDETMKFLSSVGFYVSKDPEIEKHYKCLSKDHRYGRYADLEFKAERYPSGFRIEFYQNIIFENSHGGFYDFDKYEKMPYLIKKQLELTTNKIKIFFSNQGIQEIETFNPKTAIDFIKKDYVESWHKHFKNYDFDLSEIDGTTEKESYNILDRDKKAIKNGQIKYFRDLKGYLNRGKVYHNINNMWWVMVNDIKVTNIASFELFDLNDKDCRGRHAKKRIPKDYLIKIEQLSKANTKELLNELKRRGLKIS